MNNLELVKSVGFDFSWDEKKAWELDIPVTTMNVSELEWHFDVPLWNEGSEIYNLSPRDVMEHPELHPVEAERVARADTSHPLDVMENKGRWLLIDGLHRLTKLYMEGKNEVSVRVIPRTLISLIMNYEETVEVQKNA